MTRLPVISGRACVKALKKAGFELDRRRGSHMVLRREEQQPVLTVTVPDHKELDKGTLKGIIKQAGLTDDEFIALL